MESEIVQSEIPFSLIVIEWTGRDLINYLREHDPDTLSFVYLASVPDL